MIKNFLKFVEIRTKITCLFTFLMSLAFIFYTKQEINIKLTLIFFVSMFVFDLTTTAINNYIDSKDYPEMLPFSRQFALTSIIIMFVFSMCLGLYLAYSTDIIVLALGVLCFLCGVFYTYGPIPISRTPLGELFSGVFQGTIITFLMLYINLAKNTFLTLTFNLSEINLSIKIVPFIITILLSLVPTLTIANIMLANNTCDVDSDICVKRYTLPYYIGTNKAVKLFALFYYICYINVVIMIFLRILHPICLLILITLPMVQKNINIFSKQQKKSVTFITSIKNYLIIMISYSLLIFISGILVRL